MKYFLLILALAGCSTAHIVNAPPDGKHLPLTVTCEKIQDCADLIVSVCHHNHYLVNNFAKTNGTYRISAQCN